MTICTVRPGPVLHVFRDGQEIIAVTLSTGAALALCRDLITELWGRV